MSLIEIGEEIVGVLLVKIILVEKGLIGKLGQLPKGYDHKHTYSHIGYNLKVTDMQAAIGCSQLEKLEDFIEARKQNYIKIYEKLSSLKIFLFFLKKIKKVNQVGLDFL